MWIHTILITQVYKFGSTFGPEQMRTILNIIWCPELRSSIHLSRLVQVFEFAHGGGTAVL